MMFYFAEGISGLGHELTGPLTLVLAYEAYIDFVFLQRYAREDERDARLLHVNSAGGSYLNRCNSQSVVDVGLKTKHIHLFFYF
jgi:hypothetical protein